MYLSRLRCVRPSLLPLCPRPKSSSLPPRAMASPRLPHPGKLVASLGRTLPSSLTGRCAVPPISHLWHTSGARKPMEACAWSMRPASAVVVPVPCATSVNGMAALPLSRAFVSVLLHPLVVGSAPLLWRDWSRREHRRGCQQLVRHQRIEVSLPPPAAASPRKADVILSRAHSRLSWAERLARNARVPTASQVTIRLFGVPESFATSLGRAPG